VNGTCVVGAGVGAVAVDREVGLPLALRDDGGASNG